jgi:hypothetical protein
VRAVTLGTEPEAQLWGSATVTNAIDEALRAIRVDFPLLCMSDLGHNRT